MYNPPSAGVMNGGRTVTKDTCLYAEDYAFTLARERTNGTQQTAIVVRSPGMRCGYPPAHGRQTSTRGPMATPHPPSARPSLRTACPFRMLGVASQRIPGRMSLPPACAPTLLLSLLPLFKAHFVSAEQWIETLAK